MRSLRVTEAELRQIFNERHFYERMQNGEFRSYILHLTRRRSGDRRVRHPMSRMVEYRDHIGRRVALVHQYRLPDGSLGGSGKPDPKFVVVGDTTYYISENLDLDMPEW